jgi:hypothetical protein
MWFGRKKKPRAFQYGVDQVADLARGRGGCIASKRAIEDGFGIFYMSRSEPVNDVDSGWAFLHGSEDEAYMDDPANHLILDVNTVANVNPAVIEHLDAPFGSAFTWNGDGFIPVPNGPPSRDGTLH